jgi:hypothetical protein
MNMDEIIYIDSTHQLPVPMQASVAHLWSQMQNAHSIRSRSRYTDRSDPTHANHKINAPLMNAEPPMTIKKEMIIKERTAFVV